MSNTALLLVASSLAAVIHSAIMYFVAKIALSVGFTRGAKAAAKAINEQLSRASVSTEK